MTLLSVNSDGTTTFSGVLNPPPASSSIVAGATAAAGLLVSALRSSNSSDSLSSGGVAILCARGTTIITQLGEGSRHQPGYYAIEEWVRSTTAPAAPVLFTGVQIGHRDVTGRVLCMDNIKVLYSFGQNYGDVMITGEILLGNYGDLLNSQTAVKQFADFFWTNRVSNLLYPVTVSAVNEKYLVYLEGMDFADIDPQFNILPFVLHGTLLDISRDAAASASSSGLVLTTTNVNTTSIIAGLSATTVPGSAVTGVTASATSDTASQPSQAPLNNTPTPVTSNPDNQPAFTGAPGSNPTNLSVTPATTPASIAQAADDSSPAGKAVVAASDANVNAQTALQSAQNNGVTGDALTPYQSAADTAQANLDKQSSIWQQQQAAAAQDQAQLVKTSATFDGNASPGEAPSLFNPHPQN